jgi:hypothetical protein
LQVKILTGDRVSCPAERVLSETGCLEIAGSNPVAPTERPQLVVRDLNKKYFEDKNHGSADELRKLIEEHLDDDAIYEGGGNVLTRVAE